MFPSSTLLNFEEGGRFSATPKDNNDVLINYFFRNFIFNFPFPSIGYWILPDPLKNKLPLTYKYK